MSFIKNGYHLFVLLKQCKKLADLTPPSSAYGKQDYACRNYGLFFTINLHFSVCFAVCDPKSLLFLFGMQLDYSDALIGGGFSFKNPNATKTCGCGKSFAA
jgi:hypothetical protein